MDNAIIDPITGNFYWWDTNSQGVMRSHVSTFTEGATMFVEGGHYNRAPNGVVNYVEMYFTGNASTSRWFGQNYTTKLMVMDLNGNVVETVDLPGGMNSVVTLGWVRVK